MLRNLLVLAQTGWSTGKSAFERLPFDLERKVPGLSAILYDEALRMKI